MDIENEDCCGLGSRVGTRPTPTKITEIIRNSVGASLVASVSTIEDDPKQKGKMP
jgi:hypothetical protein